MKLDIEGAEYAVLPHLIARGALCEVGAIAIELHAPPPLPRTNRSGGARAAGELEQKVWSEAQRAAQACGVDLQVIDDEYHGSNGIVLPAAGELCGAR